MRLTPAAAIRDVALLGRGFGGASWDRWRAVLKAAYGERLGKNELERFRAVAARDPPVRPVKELWVIAGRRAGKDSIAAAIAATASLGDYRRYLRPGERASVLCLAVDRDQARIVHRYIKALFADNDLLRPLVARETDSGIELNNDVEIIIATNSFRAVRGRTIVAVILDEVAFWRDADSANPDTEVFNALQPGLVTIPNSLLIGISTPYRRAGLLYDKYSAYYAQPSDDVLVVKGPSTAFNPTLPQSAIDEALARDPEAAAAEWLGEFRSDISDFLDRALIEAAVDQDVIARSPQPTKRYLAFADPSGGRGDSFTCGIAHLEGETGILDALYERRSPFDPTGVVAEIAGLLQNYRVGRVTGDRYAAGWVSEAFAKHGIAYEASERDRSAVYLDALPLFTAGRARLLDHPRLIHQFINLERRAQRSGRDRVDHPPGSHDDLANAAAGALVLAAADPAAIWSRPWAITRGNPSPIRRNGSAILYAQERSARLHALRFR